MMGEISLTGMKLPAQVTIIVLILTFVALIVSVAMLPTIQDQITPIADNLDNQGDHMTAMMLRLFPFFILIGILISFLWYVMPKYG
jgi:predicted PurR-regulated permease PerM